MPNPNHRLNSAGIVQKKLDFIPKMVIMGDVPAGGMGSSADTNEL